MFLFPKSFKVDWVDAETSRQRRDFAQILQLLMWIRTTLFAVGVHRILLYRIPAEGIPEGGEFWLQVYLSTVQRMQDVDCGFD